MSDCIKNFGGYPFMGEKVLVLGGSYFVGRKIAVDLCENGYHVSILNRGTMPCPSSKIEQIICDRNNKEDMKEVLRNKRFDYIIDVSWKDMDWVETLCSTVCFSRVKAFVFISSSSVYDIEHLQTPFKEGDSLSVNKFWTFYGQGKIDAEQYYQEFFKDKDTNLIILRPPYIYGEFNYAQRESFIFHHICEEKEIIIPSSNPLLQFIYSGDLADIIRYLLQENKKKTAIYNVGNKMPVSAKKWIDLCSQIVGKTVKVVEYDYNTLGRNVRDFFPFFDYNNVLDVSEINKLYSKEKPLIEGLRSSYTWYAKNKGDINFKQNIEQTIYDIILELNK